MKVIKCKYCGKKMRDEEAVSRQVKQNNLLFCSDTCADQYENLVRE